MAASIQLAEHENEDLIALIVADMHDPVTPILEAEFVGGIARHWSRDRAPQMTLRREATRR